MDVRAFLTFLLSPSNIYLAYTLTISLIKQTNCKIIRTQNIFDYFPQRPLHFLKFYDQEDMCRDLTPKKFLNYDTCIVFSVSAKPQQKLIGFARNLFGDDMTWIGETM